MSEMFRAIGSAVLSYLTLEWTNPRIFREISCLYWCKVIFHLSVPFVEKKTEQFSSKIKEKLNKHKRGYQIISQCSRKAPQAISTMIPFLSYLHENEGSFLLIK